MCEVWRLDTSCKESVKIVADNLWKSDRIVLRNFPHYKTYQVYLLVLGKCRVYRISDKCVIHVTRFYLKTWFIKLTQMRTIFSYLIDGYYDMIYTTSEYFLMISNSYYIGCKY